MRALRLFTLAAALAALAGPAAAQSWTSNATDDGVWFFAGTAPPDRGIEFHCGGRSPQNRPFAENPIGEPMITRTNQIMLSISTRHLPLDDGTRNDVALVVDGRAFGLPAVTFSDFEGVHEQPLDINDPLFAALREGRRVTLTAAGVPAMSWALAGSSAGIRRMAAHCASRWRDPPGPALPFTRAAVAAPPPDSQGWAAELRADARTVAVAAQSPASNLRIGCVRPNRTGLASTDSPPILGPVTPPGRLAVAVLTLSLPPFDGGPNPRRDVWLRIDDVFYPVPPLRYDGGAAWWGQIVQGHPIVGALGQGEKVEINRAGETVGRSGTDGLSGTLAQVLDLCALDALPPDVLARVGAAPGTGAMEAVDRYVAEWCPSGGAVAPDALLFGDLDGDGRGDAVLDAAGYTCGGMRPQCGAAFCSALVFLSSRDGAPPFDYLTLGVALTTVGGRTALRLDTAMGTCSNPFTLSGCSGQTLVYRNGAMVAVGGN